MSYSVQTARAIDRAASIARCSSAEEVTSAHTLAALFDSETTVAATLEDAVPGIKDHVLDITGINMAPVSPARVSAGDVPMSARLQNVIWMLWKADSGPITSATLLVALASDDEDMSTVGTRQLLAEHGLDVSTIQRLCRNNVARLDESEAPSARATVSATSAFEARAQPDGAT